MAPERDEQAVALQKEIARLRKAMAEALSYANGSAVVPGHVTSYYVNRLALTARCLHDALHEDPDASLPFERIEALASMDGVDRRAVENFLLSLPGLTQAEALANLEHDTRMYGWGTATGRAIQQGVMEARLG
jgi:hypothetical protein